jgi:hypothetical protein
MKSETQAPRPGCDGQGQSFSDQTVRRQGALAPFVGDQDIGLASLEIIARPSFHLPQKLALVLPKYAG